MLDRVCLPCQGVEKNRRRKKSFTGFCTTIVVGPILAYIMYAIISTVRVPLVKAAAKQRLDTVDFRGLVMEIDACSVYMGELASGEVETAVLKGWFVEPASTGVYLLRVVTKDAQVTDELTYDVAAGTWVLHIVDGRPSASRVDNPFDCQVYLLVSKQYTSGWPNSPLTLPSIAISTFSAEKTRVLRKDLWSDDVWSGKFRPPVAPATAYYPNRTAAATPAAAPPGQSAVVRELAFARETLQSSINYGGVSSRAVDGNPNGYYANGSCTYTQEQPNPWWQAPARHRQATIAARTHTRARAHTHTHTY
jgi:hypothetical protein